MVLAETETELDAFLAVVNADADWLRAEFDAIVAASWNPPRAGAERSGGPVAMPLPPKGTGFRDDVMPAEQPVAAWPARERSPPGGWAGLRWSSAWSSRYIGEGG
jgi:hypothetical protein